MRTVLSAAVLSLVMAGGIHAAQAEPVEKATALPLAVTLDWEAFGQRAGAVHLDCRIFDASGNPVGRGSAAGELDPAYLTSRGAVDTTMPAVVYAGTDPDGGLNCSCRARFDTRSIFHRSGADDFGRRPFMFYRPMHRVKTTCEPEMALDDSRTPS